MTQRLRALALSGLTGVSPISGFLDVSFFVSLEVTSAIILELL